MTKRSTTTLAATIRADLRARLIAHDITPQRADELLGMVDGKREGM